MASQKYLAQIAFGMSMLVGVQSFGAAVDDEERRSFCCPFARFFVRSNPIPAPASLQTSTLVLTSLDSEEDQNSLNDGGYENVGEYVNVQGEYSNVSGNDQLGEVFPGVGVSLERPPSSDTKHLSFKTGAGANYVPTDSNV